MKLKELPLSERPREKLLKYGKENLSDSELLALVIKTGSKKESALDLSINLLKKIEKIQNLKYLNYEMLTEINGIGKAKAIELLAIAELCKRLYYDLDNDEKIKFSKPEVIYEKNKYLFDGINQEHFYCLYLNSKKELIERKLLFMGTLNKSVVHPREIFKEAYRLSASSIVCMHNHPSGDKTPSNEDIILTKSLIELGKINGIPVIDHIIFANDDYYSFYRDFKLQTI